MVTRRHGGVLLRAATGLRDWWTLRLIHNHPVASAFSTTATSQVHSWPIITELQRRGWRQVPSSTLSAAVDDTPASLSDLLHQPSPLEKQGNPTDQLPRASEGDGHNAEFYHFVEVLNKYTQLLDSVTQTPELPKELTQKDHYQREKRPLDGSGRRWIPFSDKKVRQRRPWLPSVRRRLVQYHRWLGVQRPDGN